MNAAERLGEMAEANNCKDPDSAWCQAAKNNNRIVDLTFGLIGALLFIGAIVGVVMLIVYLLKESGILDSIHL